jgi:hypothetical protein
VGGHQFSLLLFRFSRSRMLWLDAQVAPFRARCRAWNAAMPRFTRRAFSE